MPKSKSTRIPTRSGPTAGRHLSLRWRDEDDGTLAATFETVTHDAEGIDEWRVTGLLRLAGDQLVLAELCVSPTPIVALPSGRARRRKPSEVPGTGLDSEVLRSIRVGQIMAEARAQLIEAPEWAGGRAPLTEAQKGWAKAAAEAVKDRPLRRGRSGYPDDHYRRIALLYLDFQAQGVAHGINGRIAEVEGVAPTTIKDWVHQARRRGFLTAAEPGKAGALPGPRLYDVDDPDAEEA